MDNLAATGGVPGPGRIGRVAIGEHCRKHLGGFQVPKLVRIVEEMPMTATGKLRKVELRQAYADHFAAKSA